jgi:hypothetical protein
VLFPKASFRVTEMVQSEFRVYVPTMLDALTVNCCVELAKMLPAPSKYSFPEDAKGTEPVAPLTN